MKAVTQLKILFTVVMSLMGMSVTSEGLLSPIIIKTILSHPNANPFDHFAKSPLNINPDILEGQTSEVKSVLDGVGALLCLFMTPLLGAVSDKYGRKPVLMFAFVCFVVDYVLLSVAYWQSWLWCMLLSKVASSLAMSHTAICSAYMSDLFPPEERARAFGIVAAAIGMGLVLGPSTVGYFGRNNFYIGLGIGLGSVVVALALMCFLRESLHYGEPAEMAATNQKPFNCSQHINPFRTLSTVLTRNNLYLTGLTIIFILYCLAVTDVMSTMVLYTNYRYNWNLLQIGLCESYMGALMCFNQGVMLRIYEKRLGLRKMLVCGFLISTGSHMLYAFAYKWWMFVVGLLISSAGFVGHPAIQALITNAADSSKRGAVLGAMGALQSLCTLAGGVTNDNLFAFFISGKAFIKFSGPQFFLGSLLFAMSATVSIILFNMYSEKRVATLVNASIQSEDVQPILYFKDEEEEGGKEYETLDGADDKPLLLEH